MIRLLDLSEIQVTLSYPEIVRRMWDAVISHSSGETPMPMHLEVAAERADLTEGLRRIGIELRAEMERANG